MVLLCSFFVDVALKLWKASSAGRSRAGWRRNWILRKKSKDQTQINCKGRIGKKPQYFADCTLKYLLCQRLPTVSIDGARLPGFASQAAKDTSSKEHRRLRGRD
jgi:hypothetical protein